VSLAVSAFQVQQCSREEPKVRFKKILCPIDFFKASSKAFDYGLKLATNYGAKVHALHVIVPVIPSASDAAYNIVDLTANQEKDARRFLEKLKTKTDRAQVVLTTEVRFGDADREILHTVETQKADLVVMGTHGRRGFERLVMGSVAERLMRSCPVPLLIVGLGRKSASTPPNIRRILLTTDFSEGTPDAVTYALSIARESRAKLTLLHVLHDIAADVAGKYRDPLMRGIEVQMQKLIPENSLDGVDFETRIEEGLPSKIIPEVVKSGFDLLVMNIHGKGMLDRALLGSTAERTLRTSAEFCPVLLIPPKKVSKESGVRVRKG
jgi:nucleotide-binding universal stress UspA family protein